MVRIKGIVDFKFIFFLTAAISFYFQQHFNRPEVKKRSDYIAPPAIVKNLSMGLNVQFSDSFWLRAVQDFDFCDRPLNGKECQGGSWLFQVIDLVTELDPKFEESYFYGSLALTILVSDYEGASRIFDKGTESFPASWQLNYAAGYHAMIEEKNYLKAAKRYEAAAKYGAPDWVRVLAGTLAAKGGDTEFAEKIVEQMIELNDEPRYIERLKAKLEAIKNKKSVTQ